MSVQTGIGSTLKLRWYLLAIGIVTFILLGVEGGFVWAVSACAAVLIVKMQKPDKRSYLIPVLIWCFLIFVMWRGAH